MIFYGPGQVKPPPGGGIVRRRTRIQEETMKNKLQKVTSLMLTVAMGAMFMAGCSSNQTPEATPTATPVPTESAAPQEPPVQSANDRFDVVVIGAAARA